MPLLFDTYSRETNILCGFKVNVFVKQLANTSQQQLFKKSKHFQFLTVFSKIKLYQISFSFLHNICSLSLQGFCVWLFSEPPSSRPFSFCLLNSALKILLLPASCSIRCEQDRILAAKENPLGRSSKFSICLCTKWPLSAKEIGATVLNSLRRKCKDIQNKTELPASSLL